MLFLFKHLPAVVASALLLLSTPILGATWFELQDPRSTYGVKVEADLESLRSVGENRQLVLRIAYAQPQQKPEIRFQSVVAGIEIFCNSDLAFWKTAHFFSGTEAKGVPLVTENYGQEGVPSRALNLLPDSLWKTLQKSACSEASTASP